MPKYLMLWEGDATKFPANPKERANALLPLFAALRQDIQSGILKDWGGFLAENEGFCIVEGAEEEIQKTIDKYRPMIRFYTHPFLTMEQTERMLKDVAK